MVKNVLVVEDDKIQADCLIKMIGELSIKTRCYWAKDLKDAYWMMHENNIDLFLIDIILNPSDPSDVSGMKFADELRTIQNYKHTPVVFITALVDPELYAYQAIHSYSYIQKPFLVDRTKKTLEEALTFFPTKKEEDTYWFRKDGILMGVLIKDIMYIESKWHMLNVYEVNDFLSVPYVSCKDIFEKLGRHGFVQCAKGVIVNKKLIKSVDIVNRYISFGDGYKYKQVSVSRKYMKSLLEELDGWK